MFFRGNLCLLLLTNQPLLMRSEWQTDWTEVQNTNLASSLSSPLMFASFNIQVFGVSKYGKTEVKDQIVEILRRYDISTIQVRHN